MKKNLHAKEKISVPCGSVVGRFHRNDKQCRSNTSWWYIGYRK